MLPIEIIALCILFIIVPPLICRIVYLRYKNRRDIIQKTNASILALKTKLNYALKSAWQNNIAHPNLTAEMRIKRVKILDKLDKLIVLISIKSQAEMTTIQIVDTDTGSKVGVRLLDELTIVSSENASDYIYIRDIIYGLLTGVFPSNEQYKVINNIYKRFRKVKTTAETEIT